MEGCLAKSVVVSCTIPGTILELIFWSSTPCLPSIKQPSCQGPKPYNTLKKYSYPIGQNKNCSSQIAPFHRKKCGKTVRRSMLENVSFAISESYPQYPHVSICQMRVIEDSKTLILDPGQQAFLSLILV
jgi:hypothetical protein